MNMGVEIEPVGKRSYMYIVYSLVAHDYKFSFERLTDSYSSIKLDIGCPWCIREL